LAESEMTESMIEETEVDAEEFTDELSDEALDRDTRAICIPCMCRH
jgi:hypothetical protein